MKSQHLSGIVITIMLMVGCKSRFVEPVVVDGWFFNHPVTMTLVADSREEFILAANMAMNEIKRLEEKFNPANPDGGLYNLNSLRLSTNEEMYWLLKRASGIRELTSKKFNPLAGLLEESYGFNKLFPKPPTPSLIREIILPIDRASMEFLDARTQIQLDNDTYYVSMTGVQEGYAADQALAHLMIGGIHEAKVEIGPYIACGASPDGLGWEIRVPNPAADDKFTLLHVENSGVAIASRLDGAYSYRNRMYFNQLDPFTGMPGDIYHSVAIVAPNCELAGELAKGLFLMDPKEGLALLNNMTDAEGLFIKRDGTILMSDSMQIWLEE